jgi:hypothetical protein
MTMTEWQDKMVWVAQRNAVRRMELVERDETDFLDELANYEFYFDSVYRFDANGKLTWWDWRTALAEFIEARADQRRHDAATRMIGRAP